MLRRRRNKFKGRKPADRFFMLLAILLVAYAMFAGEEDILTPQPVSSLRQGEETEPPDFLEDSESDTLADKLLTSFEIKEQPIGLALDVRAGEGTAAQCGQKVTVRYFSRLLDGVPVEDFYDEEKDPITFRIGKHEGKILPGIEQYTIGMRKKSERHVTLPPEKAYDAEGFRKEDVPLGSPVSVRIKLLGMEENPDMYQVSGHSTIVSGDTRRMVWCGEKVTVLLYALPRGSDVRRRLPEDAAHHITFETGAAEVPYWLEQTVTGNGRFPPMQLGGVRLIGISDEILERADSKNWVPLTAVKNDPERDKVNFRVHLVAIGEEKAQDIGIKRAVPEAQQEAEKPLETIAGEALPGDELPSSLPEKEKGEEADEGTPAP